MYSITNDFEGILARIPNEGGRKLLDSCAIMGYVPIIGYLTPSVSFMTSLLSLTAVSSHRLFIHKKNKNHGGRDGTEQINNQPIQLISAPH
jgi:hypothetical protein